MPKKLTHEEVVKEYQKYNLILLEKYKKSKIRIKTLCYCGNEFLSLPNSVFCGTSISCGCLQKKKARELQISEKEVIERYSKRGLILLEKYKGSLIKLKTKCICSKEFYSLPLRVFSGKGISCGCYKRKMTIDANSKVYPKQIYGKLTVLNFDHYHYSPCGGRTLYFMCQCSCGNKKAIRSRSLLKGDTKTCGECEDKINGILVSNKQLQLHSQLGRGIVNFKTGKYYPDIAFAYKGKKIAIEYDCVVWHDDVEKKKRRDKYLVDNGWKVLHIITKETVPSNSTIFSLLDYMIDNSQNILDYKIGNINKSLKKKIKFK